MAEPLLHLAHVTKRFRQTVAAEDLTLDIYRGEFFTLLGPSGSGKSTVLRIIAGLERPDAGRVFIEGKDVAGIPPWRRGLGMVFQQYALFPHMNVAQNVGYGLRFHRASPAEIRARVTALLDLVGLEGMEERDVTLLSGGEQQRVALARALAVRPSLLLLDEPLSALDEKIRREMETELQHIQRQTGTTFVYVTHDQEEALTMSDRIAVLHRGVCVQCGAPEALFRRPRTRFVAHFFRGSNVLEGDLLTSAEGRMALRINGRVLILPSGAASIPRGPRVAVAIRAEDVRIGPRARECTVQMDAALIDIIYRGTTVDHVLELPDRQRLVATSAQREAGDARGQTVLGFNLEDAVVLED